MVPLLRSFVNESIFSSILFLFEILSLIILTILEPTTTPSVKVLIFSTSFLLFIPKPATIGKLDSDLIKLIDDSNSFKFAEF